MSVVARGALAGWKRRPTEHGFLMTLQVAASTEAYRARDFDVVEVALNDRQLRSLARDLHRAAQARGIELSAQHGARRWERLRTPWRRLRALLR
jgi:hypothetical protein